MELPPDPTDPYPSGTTVQVYWEGEKKWYTGNITKTDVWRGPNGLSKQPRRQIHISYDDGVDKVHSLHNTKVRTVVPSEAETGVEESQRRSRYEWLELGCSIRHATLVAKLAGQHAAATA